MSRAKADYGAPRLLVLGALVITLGVWSERLHAAEGSRPGIQPLPDSLEGGGRGDGVYGRFDGAFALAIAGGIEAAPASGAVRPSALVTTRFYQTAGLALGYSQAVMQADPLERSASASLLLEPLFLVRWSGDQEWGHAFWDLLLDSISLSAGVLLAESRGGTFGDAAAFRAGLGAGVPLLARASGPWLRFGGQIDAGLEPNVVGTLSVRLEWQWILRGRARD